MPVIDIENVFRKNCGDAEFISGKMGAGRDGLNVVMIRFKIMPEDRAFDLDGVIHGPTAVDLENAVRRIAYIAATVREHIKPDEVKA